MEEFAKIEDYEDLVDEAYDFLLVRFDTIDKEEFYFDDTTPKVSIGMNVRIGTELFSRDRIAVTLYGHSPLIQATTSNAEDHMGYWHHRLFTPSTHDPFA